MKRYFNKRIMIISTAAILLTAFFCTYAYYRVFREEVVENLKVYCRLLSESALLEDDKAMSRYADEMYDDNIRLTLVSKTGEVLFDDMANAEDLSNHRNRAEIEEAMEKGEGSSVRRSETINRTNYYYAIRLENGSVLRAARESRSMFALFMNALPVIFLSILLIFLVCLLTVSLSTRKFLAPIEALASNMDTPENVEIYEELAPIINHIKDQHRSIMEYADLRQDFTANVTHELKTPLTVISGYSELIEKGLAGEEDTRKFAGEIYKSANRQLTLINDILRLTELDFADPSEFVMEPVDLYAISKTCVEMLEVKAESHQVSLRLEGEPTEVMANHDMIEEIVYNLCDNAIRYNKPGGHVIITAEKGCLTVSDNGIGIPEEYHTRIFERFFRVDKSRSKKTGGTGLGLAIVKHTATLQGAELFVDSTENVGTTIGVRFPMINDSV